MAQRFRDKSIGDVVELRKNNGLDGRADAVTGRYAGGEVLLAGVCECCWLLSSSAIFSKASVIFAIRNIVSAMSALTTNVDVPKAEGLINSLQTAVL